MSDFRAAVLTKTVEVVEKKVFGLTLKYRNGKIEVEGEDIDPEPDLNKEMNAAIQQIWKRREKRKQDIIDLFGEDAWLKEGYEEPEPEEEIVESEESDEDV